LAERLNGSCFHLLVEYVFCIEWVCALPDFFGPKEQARFLFFIQPSFRTVNKMKITRFSKNYCYALFKGIIIQSKISVTCRRREQGKNTKFGLYTLLVFGLSDF